MFEGVKIDNRPKQLDERVNSLKFTGTYFKKEVGGILMKAKVYNGYSDETAVGQIIGRVKTRMDAKPVDSRDRIRPQGESILAFAGKGTEKLESAHIQSLQEIEE